MKELVQEEVIGENLDSSKAVRVEENSGVTFFGKNVSGIAGSTIKIIAILSMLIDHSAAVLIMPLCDNDRMIQLYMILRDIGRLGFPIFCFLLVEGFMHTRSKLKYGFRLALFALVSEIPFDLAFNYSVLEFGYQNVFFTLLLGFVVMAGLDAIEKRLSVEVPLKITFGIVVIAVGMYIAHIMNTDYAATGVAAITVMYLLRNFKVEEMFGGCMVLTLSMLNEAYAFFCMIPVALYNGKRGLKLKYFFYAFYPVHLLLLVLLAYLFGLR